MTKREDTAKDAVFRKYAKTSRNDIDPEKKLKPSEFYRTAQNLNIDEYPRIVEYNNMSDNTAQLHSTVRTDQPLFQSSPDVVVFEDYAPFSVQEKKLYFRNNDSVSHLMSGTSCIGVVLKMNNLISDFMRVKLETFISFPFHRETMVIEDPDICLHAASDL